MFHYITYEVATGNLIGTSEAPGMPEMPDGYAAIECEWIAQPWRYQVVDGVVIERGTPLDPPAPPPVPIALTFNEWIDMLLPAEQLALADASLTDGMTKLIYDRYRSASGSIAPAVAPFADGLLYLLEKGTISQATFTRMTSL